MLNFTSPLEAFLHWEKEIPDRIFLNQPVNGKITSYTFKQVGDEARRISGRLKAYNLPDKSHIAILSKNCAHWVMSDLAIMMANYVSVPLYFSLNSESVNQILEHSDAKAVIIGKLDDYELKVRELPNIHKISIGLYGGNDGEIWEDIIENQDKIDRIVLPKKEDLFTIIYTSGTTGDSKGVMHTVENIMECSNVLINQFSVPNHTNLFSYLPMAHIAERAAMEIASIITAANLSFSESMDTYAKDLERVQPYIYFAVPRIWTKFQEKILESIPQKRLNFLLAIPLVNSLIKRKLKQKLGLKNAKIIVSSAAPISVSLIKWYRRIGVNIIEVYGMTEDCAISHGSPPYESKIGTVGRPYNGVQAKLSEQGEVLVKNKCLMKGYYKEPELTAKSFTEDGYLKTGDIGEYDHDGYLTITGRVKDQFKTDKGKYISPAPIELKLSKNTDIEQVCIVGMGIPQPIALVTLSQLGREKTRTDLSKGLINIVSEVNKNLDKHEKVEKVVVMKEDWNVDNGLTTPTLKIKRNAIEKIHQPYYKQWFEGEDKVIFE